MREALDQMLFVYACYVLTIVSTLVLVGQSWFAMRRAEARREKVRKK